MYNSFNTRQVVAKILSSCGSQIPVTYAGGVTVMADLEKIKVAGMGRVDVTVGSALDIFGGDLAYKDVVAWHALQNSLVL
ncbi:hypothetical protein FXO37_30133 [Capsicum annuum]|nr:hypothetical protein FXO37_30133 [Capsicum annuum]